MFPAAGPYCRSRGQHQWQQWQQQTVATAGPVAAGVTNLVAAEGLVQGAGGLASLCVGYIWGNACGGAVLKE